MDWCKKSGLSSFYIIQGNFICEFCYRICGYENKGEQIQKKNDILQICECGKLNGVSTHSDYKHNFTAMLELIESKDELIIGIQPNKFMNLLFLGKFSYNSIFFVFEEMFQKLKKVEKDN